MSVSLDGTATWTLLLFLDFRFAVAPCRMTARSGRLACWGGIGTRDAQLSCPLHTDSTIG